MIDKLVSSPTLTLIIRMATLLCAGFLIWLNVRFNDQQADIDDLKDNMKATMNAVVALDRRTTVVETNNANGRSDRIQFQDAMTTKVDVIGGQLATMNANLAALTATVQSLKERQAFNLPRTP